VDFIVWLPMCTVTLIQQSFPEYHQVLCSTNFDMLQRDCTLTCEGLMCHDDHAVGGKKRMRDFKPNECAWPAPTLMDGSQMVLGPVSFPRLTDQSDSFLRYMHAMQAMADQSHLDATTPAYQAAFDESGGLMIDSHSKVPWHILRAQYSSFCEKKQLSRVDAFAHGTTTTTTAGYLLRFNLNLIPNSGYDSGHVQGIRLASRPMKLPTERRHLEMLQHAATGFGVDKELADFFPEGHDTDPHDCREYLQSIVTGRRPLLNYTPAEPGRSAQDEALALTGPSLPEQLDTGAGAAQQSEEPTTDAGRHLPGRSSAARRQQGVFYMYARKGR